MKRLIIAASLAVATVPAFSLNGSVGPVANPQECPPGSRASANYKWEGGRLVREGWACQRESSN